MIIRVGNLCTLMTFNIAGGTEYELRHVEVPRVRYCLPVIALIFVLLEVWLSYTRPSTTIHHIVS